MNNSSESEKFFIVLKRKIVTAVLSSVLFALIFSLVAGWDFEGDGFANMYYLNFMFVMTYGLVVSMFSDWLSGKITKRTFTREIVSFFIHCLFGSILLVMSLVSAISFFAVDRLLAKVKISWLTVIIALAAVVLVFVIMMNR